MERQRERQATILLLVEYPFAKLMEIAESVPTGRVRQAKKIFKRQATKF